MTSETSPSPGPKADDAVDNLDIAKQVTDDAADPVEPAASSDHTHVDLSDNDTFAEVVEDDSLSALRSENLDLLGVPLGVHTAHERGSNAFSLSNDDSLPFVEESLEESAPPAEEPSPQAKPSNSAAQDTAETAPAGASSASASGATTNINHLSASGASSASAASAALDHCFSLTTGALLTAAYDVGPVKVWVREPEKVFGTNALGMKTTHYNFLVRTESSLEGLVADGMEVRRRFSEFDTLHKLLHKEFKGCFIPPLPEKSLRMEGRIGVGGSSHEDFMRLRRADLQAYLRAVVSHPMLVHSNSLSVFLLQTGELGRNPAWLKLLEPPQPTRAGYETVPSDGHASSSPSQQPQPASPSAVSSLVSWVRSSIATVSANQYLPVAESQQREVPQDETFLNHAKEMLSDLEKLLYLACESARMLCQDTDKMCEDFREFGRSMGMLAHYEEALKADLAPNSNEAESAGRRCYNLQRVAICSAKQHNIWRTNCVKTAANMVFLRDFHLLVPEAIAAMEHRENAFRHLQHVESELTRVSQLASQTQASSLSQSISRLEEQVNEARSTYDLIKSRNQDELKRFGLERESRFHSMLALFAATQASMVQAAADAWAALANQYTAVASPEAAAP